MVLTDQERVHTTGVRWMSICPGHGDMWVDSPRPSDGLDTFQLNFEGESFGNRWAFRGTMNESHLEELYTLIGAALGKQCVS